MGSVSVHTTVCSDVDVAATQDGAGQEDLVSGISPRHREMDSREETVMFITVFPLPGISLLFFFVMFFFLAVIDDDRNNKTSCHKKIQ